MIFEVLPQALANGLVSGTILAVPAIGFTAIFAIRLYPNFMIGAVATVGAYAGWAANTSLGLSLWPALVVAFLVAAAVGLATEKVAVRPLEPAGPLTMAIASLAMAIVLENVIRFIYGNDLKGFDTPLERDVVWWGIRVGPQQLRNLATALAIMALLWAGLRFTRFGRAMRACADNPDLARLKGIEPVRIADVTVAVALGLCGIGGMLVGVDASVDPMTGTRLLLSVFAAAVLGGLGSIPGAVVGALSIGIVEELTVAFLSPAYRLAVGFLVILVVLTFRPRGLLGTATR
ncbi:branched-chain amino acid ABC transporter permease [Acuticoccus mangrovi]|uniref:Branched-chain amino acid ABC transporter permease n=1 Tax=Acuticoccus mangrovi TaxID=2796142 RepID=A0A934MJJ1_9HYPH|nr:branched-chain amino acid ABC transporter permease [Acuticoccus mangrovi]MBJ3778361.1 branched-chain amino acid ABC transporter permease [Acuticoccus mangrovi]